MENQHKQIPGYRDWDAGTTGIIAGLKSFFNKELQERVDMVRQMLAHQASDAHQRRKEAQEAQECAHQMTVENAGDESARDSALMRASKELDQANADLARITEAGRWLSMARTDFQTGAMKLIRAVAQPTTEY